LELHYLYNKDNRAHKEERCHFNARLAASACLSRLKKVRKKICLKEFYLVKQGLYKLESEERGSSLKDLEIVLYSPVVGSSAALGLPLTDLFFNPSFSLLPDLISSNIFYFYF